MCHATEQRVTSIVPGAGEIHRFHQEDGEDDKSKDPLQGNDLDGELLYSQGQHQPTQTIPQDIILGGNNVRRPHGKNHPDKHIGHDPRRDAIAVHRDSPVPE